MTDSVHIVTTCPNELRELVVRDLEVLGFLNIRPGFRSVEAEGSLESFYRAHFRLPVASQIFQVVRRSSAKSPNMLFSQARRVKWPSLIPDSATYRIDGIAGDRGDDSMPSSLISKKTRQAIEDVFAYQGLNKPKVDVKEPDVIIASMVRDGKVTISVQTSGKSLHKRGYRLEGHPAPLKETLAHAICRFSGYDGSQPFWDPMCGSGTVGIEAAMIALNKSPLIHRKKAEFGLERLPSFDKELWRQVQESERQARSGQPSCPIYLSDIDEKYVALARKNALRARVEKDLQLSTKSFLDSPPPCDSGILVANLPYGERLSDPGQDLETFYHQVGRHLRQEFGGWQAWLLVHEDSPWRALNLKAKRQVRLLNGSIRVRLMGFDLYRTAR